MEKVDITNYLANASDVVIGPVRPQVSASLKVAQDHASHLAEERRRNGFAWVARLRDEESALIDGQQKDQLLKAGATEQDGFVDA